MKRYLVLLAMLLAQPSLADEPKDTFKKIEKGTGELLQGIGQEIKKGADSISKGGKKDEKKADKPKDEKK